MYSNALSTLAPVVIVFLLAWLILRSGGVDRTDWYLYLAALAIFTLIYHAYTPRVEVAPPPNRWLRWALIALPIYVIGQLIPLPVGLLQWLSPERARLSAALGRIGMPETFAPLSVIPSETIWQLSRICGCALIFLAARNLTWREPRRVWRLATPLLIVATMEAALGVFQFFTTPEATAHGTYVNRNHFAGLLEMALPFAVAYPFSAIGSHRLMLLACLAEVSAALLLAAIAYSLSRGGFTSTLVALCLMALLWAAKRPSKRVRLLAGAIFVCALMALFTLLPPDRLVDRFDHDSDSGRVAIWQDTLRLISAYHIFGCGLGGFEAAFHPYRTTALELRMDFAHNDYLQALAELGIAGFAILAILLGALFKEAVQAIRSSGQTALAIASCGALAAILTHSVTDFNLYIPANALAAAWIAGILSGLSLEASGSVAGSRPISCQIVKE